MAIATAEAACLFCASQQRGKIQARFEILFGPDDKSLAIDNAGRICGTCALKGCGSRMQLGHNMGCAKGCEKTAPVFFPMIA